MSRKIFSFATVALLAALPASAQETAGMSAVQPSAAVPGAPAALMAQVTDAEGKALGTVTATPTPSGVMTLTIMLSGLSKGIHGAHIHETGKCEGPDFSSAGGHIAGEHDHGVMAEAGVHPGDLPNIHIPDNGAVEMQFFVPDLTPELLTDADGAAFILHAEPDDYVSQPTGNSGDRIACGVFSPAT